jgi:Sec-independent protein translocase protein TatA
MTHTGKRRPQPVALDTAEQLREATREAHAAVKDLRAAIRGARQLAGQLADEMQDRANAELAEWVNCMQADQNRHATELNAAVQRARDAIIEALTLAELEPDEEMKTLRVTFRGPLFDDKAQPHRENREA